MNHPLPSPPLADPAVLELLREAAAWRLMALFFESPDARWPEQIAALATEAADAQLAEAAVAAQTGASKGLHDSTFGPGGPAAPREVSYRDAVLSGKLLAELEHLYAAFAYRPSTPEPPDHVAVEAGFVAYLYLKEAYARSAAEEEAAAVTRAAREAFLAEHVACVAGPLAASLAASPITYLRLAAGALAQRVPCTGPASS